MTSTQQTTKDNEPIIDPNNNPGKEAMAQVPPPISDRSRRALAYTGTRDAAGLPPRGVMQELQRLARIVPGSSNEPPSTPRSRATQHTHDAEPAPS
eukprot:12742304-Heterocapsa_arctica.AAC.1